MSGRRSAAGYSIREAAVLTGLPASTLRYYESIGLTPTIGRGASSGHRVYDDGDLEELTWLACLAATGMSVKDMQRYVGNSRSSPVPADQIALLSAQARRLETEARHLALRQRYVALKVDYWRAVEADDAATAQRLSAEARALADELAQAKPA